MATALEELGKQLDNEMIMPLRQTLIGRQLVPVNAKLSKGGLGLTSVDVLAMTNMQNAQISFSIPTGSGDTLDPTLTNLMVPVIWEEYTLPRRVLDAYKLKGFPVESDVAIEAAYQVAIQEDKLILDGWKPDGTNYTISGLYQSAGKDYSTSKDFGTYGNPTVAVSGAINLLEQAGVYGPFDLVLHPTQKNELASSRSSNGVREWPDVEEMIGGKIISAPNGITAGTGLLKPAFGKTMPYADLIAPFKIQNILGFDSKKGKLSSLYGTCIEALVIRVKQANAFSKLSAI